MKTSYDYQPESHRHVYGKTDRWPGEKLFVKHVNEIHEAYPSFKLKLMGTSGVHGEMFPLFQTKCEFKVKDEQAVEVCVNALKTSDELIRRRIDAHWEWNSMWTDNTDIMFFVNWHDFAYFMKHKEIFLSKDHSRFALDFGLDVMTIKFEHYKIHRDGTMTIFDNEKISEHEKEIVSHLSDITFPRKYTEKRY